MGKRGTTVRKLENCLLDALEDRYGEDVETAVVTNSIAGVEGYWRRVDVRRWDGTVVVDGVEHPVSSWSTMTECVRRGITLVHESDKDELPTGYSGFDAVSKDYRRLPDVTHAGE